MNILGVDPGSNKTGYSILNYSKNRLKIIEYGVIKIESKELKESILDINLALEKIFNSHKIDEVAIESIFYAFNPQSVLKLAQFRGAILLKILQLNGDYSEYTPLQVKQSVTGNGKSSKEQVAFMVKRILNIQKEIKPLDITDSIAVAITHSQRVKLSRKKYV